MLKTWPALVVSLCALRKNVDAAVFEGSINVRNVSRWCLLQLWDFLPACLVPDREVGAAVSGCGCACFPWQLCHLEPALCAGIAVPSCPFGELSLYVTLNWCVVFLPPASAPWPTASLFCWIFNITTRFLFVLAWLPFTFKLFLLSFLFLFLKLRVCVCDVYMRLYQRKTF